MAINSQVTVIIPTTCFFERKISLLNAIRSAQEAAPGAVTVLVAVNGGCFDPGLVEYLKSRTDLKFIRFAEGSLAKTISLARPLIRTEYFCFLDDDDELLPGSLVWRLATLQNNPAKDIVLSNGFVRKNGEDSTYLHHLAHVAHDPLRSFFKENWLPSCGGLFRSSTIGPEYFQDYHPYAEWSWLAFRLAMDKKQFCVLNEPTFRVHADTPSSLSKSPEYRNAYISLYQRMLDLTPPRHIRKILRRRLSQTHHDVSSLLLAEGKISNSVRHHLLSLRHPSGWRFLPYTRHIIVAALRK
jgi:glycosyltransferase involved in cell wall biosynthesis